MTALGSLLSLKPIVSIVSAFSVVIFQTILISSLIYSLYFSSVAATGESISKSACLLRFTALGTFLCLFIAYFVWIIEEFLYQLHPNKHIWIPFYWSFYLFIAISFLLFYAFMLLKLHFIFEGSIFKVKPQTIKFHIFILISITITGFSAIVLKMMDYDKYYYRLLQVLLAICCVSLFHLIYLFNSKLFRLTLSQRRTISTPGSIASLSERQIALLQTITKQVLLGCIMISMLIVLIFVVLTYSLTHTFILWFFGWCTTMNIGTLCVYLGFSVNQHIYKCICKPCHFYCGKLCNKIAEHNLKESYEHRSDRTKQTQSAGAVSTSKHTTTNNETKDVNLVKIPMAKVDSLNIEPALTNNYTISETGVTSLNKINVQNHEEKDESEVNIDKIWMRHTSTYL
eukprot:159388_1